VKASIVFIRPRNRWRLEYRSNGKRIRQMFKTQALAKAEADRIQDDLNRAGAVWVALSGTERNEIMAVVSEIKSAGVALREVWEQFKTRQNGQPGAKVTGLQCLNEMLADKKEAKLTDDYCDNLELYVLAFLKGRETVPMCEYTVEHVKVFLRLYSVESRSTIRSRLSIWFRYGFKRGYCPGNPCELVESVKIIRPAPRVFTAPELKKLLKWLATHPRAYAWFALSTFCGLRPAEARKTKPAMINFKEGYIHVEAQTSKVRETRIVYPRPGALPFLQAAIKIGGELPLTKQQLRDEIREMRAVIKEKTWPKDITRHTAASMWLAVESVAEVAKQLGTSERILHKHYKVPTPMPVAEKFWLLLNDKPSKAR
jgi:integrase